VENGDEVHYMAFSTARESVPVGFPKNVLEIEVAEATQRLGILPDNLHVFKYTVRKLNYVRQDILEDMVQIRKSIQPDLVFMPSANDLHQDHHTVAEEAMRAFKQTTMLAYELPWNTITFSTQSFVRLETRHVDLKVHSLTAYESQKLRPYFSRDFIYGLAVTRGIQIGAHYAEAFEVVRWVI
jgi:LmbE family N-acetylglucosaminyl deacetylase